MYWIDDDRDYMYSPDRYFVGYKCPHDICDLIREDHNYCRATRVRLNALTETYDDEINEGPSFDWQGMFEFNIKQWMLKNGYDSFDSIPH